MGNCTAATINIAKRKCIHRLVTSLSQSCDMPLSQGACMACQHPCELRETHAAPCDTWLHVRKSMVAWYSAHCSKATGWRDVTAARGTASLQLQLSKGQERLQVEPKNKHAPGLMLQGCAFSHGVCGGSVCCTAPEPSQDLRRLLDPCQAAHVGTCMTHTDT